jgi:hypothetical protein
LTVIEWTILWWLRRNGRKPALTDQEVRDRLSTIDLLVVVIAIGLFVSALQYPGIASGQDARIALGIVRVALFLMGAELLWREWRAPHGR